MKIKTLAFLPVSWISYDPRAATVSSVTQDASLTTATGWDTATGLGYPNVNWLTVLRPSEGP